MLCKTIPPAILGISIGFQIGVAFTSMANGKYVWMSLRVSIIFSTLYLIGLLAVTSKETTK